MKLLIFTQIVDKNDPVLGFFHEWIREFAAQTEEVLVVCLWRGKYDLPANVKVLSLGKEDGGNKIKYLVRFYQYIWFERENYDNVFVHMNQIYVLLGAWFWRLSGKKILLWYAHGSTPLGLKLAEKFVNKIVTSTKEGCRLKSKKITIVGQGIEISKFRIKKKTNKNKKFHIVSVGRISPIKNLAVLIKAIYFLIDKKKIKKENLRISIIGAPITGDDKEYFASLRRLVKKFNVEDIVEFYGPLPFAKIPEQYEKADLFVHTGNTGSLDKTVLEAMAAGLVVVSANDAVKEMLKDYPQLCYQENDYLILAEKIIGFYNQQDINKNLGDKLRKIVEQDHSLKRLIKKILILLNNQSLKGGGKAVY